MKTTGRKKKNDRHRYLISAGFCIALCLLVSGCGYHFSGSGKLPGGIKTLYIGVFQNRTSETGLESRIANDLIYQFTRFGNLRLAEKAAADASLTGSIKSVQAVTVSHKSAYTSTERRLQLTIALKLIARDGTLLWSDKAISEYETYLVDTDKMQTEKNRKSALATLSSRVAERIYYRLTDNF